VIGSFGTRGQGPEDLIFPQFASSVNGINGLCIYDVNARKIMKIKQKNDKYFLFEKLMDYPIKIFPADNICYSGNLIVGRKIGAGSEKMFFIYDIAKDMIYETDIYPILEANVDDISYAYASNLALNTNRGKIIAGMYFFDMFHIYDLEGKRIKTVCFSKNSIPKVDQERNMLDLKNGYSGIVSVFSTEDYCYFLRYTQIPNINDTEKILIQINWDGEIINTYAINEALVTPKFCIDTQKNKMYAITHSIGADMVEYNNVVSYNLNRE
jgi:hypothetical protein